MAKKQNKRTILIVITTIVAISLLFGGKEALFGSAPTKEFKSIPGSWDISEQVQANNLEQYLVEEIDFDYSNPDIQAVAKNIKLNSATPYDAVKMTAKYVYDNIQYSSAVTVNSCYQETASSTLALGSSDCVGMTRLDVALLRAMGIPARSVGGCLKSSVRCAPIFAVAPGIQAKVTPLMEGDFKKRGFLHEWLEVFDGEKWYSLEATSGQIFDISCDQYIKYGDGYDSNQFDRCTLTDNSFWNLCSVS